MNDYRPHMLPKIRSEMVMNRAKGMPCTYRIASFVPGLQCSGPETTVGGHIATPGKAMSTKSTDIAMGFICATCHAIQEGHDTTSRAYIARNFEVEFQARQTQALIETWTLLIMDGAIIIPDAEIIT